MAALRRRARQEPLATAHARRPLATAHGRQPLATAQGRRPLASVHGRRPLTPRMLAVGALLATSATLIAMLLTAGHSAGAAGRSLSRVPTRAHRRAPPHRRRGDPRSVGHSPRGTLPFPPYPGGRATHSGEVPSLYDDGVPCSVGCRPYGAEIGWPLKPFHRQHPIRAGLNELRSGSLHVGVDIQAPDGADVYAVQPGIATVLAATGPNARVQVGNYVYWHITPAVRSGESVAPFHTVLGTVMTGYGHMAFSELGPAGQYLNPLRPGGTVLEPYVNRTRPVIGPPAVAAGGDVLVAAYSPQTFVRRTTYVTPVLAPAALAYRLYDSRGAAVTSLEWAFRGTQLLPWSEHSLIYAPGAHAPGYACFARRSICVPHWAYRLAGGLAPPLPTALPAGRYRLTIYAWDWADNETALDSDVSLTSHGWQASGRS